MKEVVSMPLTSGSPTCSEYCLKRHPRIGKPSFHRSDGFTLLELLTVVAIVGILVSIIALNQSGADRSRQLLAEAERLMLAIEQARMETTVRNEIWAVHTTRESYGFTRLNDYDEWEPITELPFQTVTVGPDIELRTELMGQEPADSGTTATNRDEPVLVLPNGELTPFQITVSLAFQNEVLTLQSDGISRVSVLDPTHELTPEELE